MTEPLVTAPPARRHLGWGAFTVAGSQVGALLAGLISSVVIARTQGPRGTGEIALVYTLVDVTVMVAGLGLSQGITYAVSHRLWSLRVGFRIAVRAALILGVGGAALALVAYAAGRSSFLEGLDLTAVLLTVSAVPAAMAASFAGTLALACDRYEVFSAIQMGQAAFGVVLIVGLVLPFGMTGAICGFALSYVVVGVAAVWWAWRFTARAGPAWAARPDADEGGRASLQAMVTFGLQAWSGNFLQYLNYRFDLFILNAYATRADVGIYSLAVSMTTLGWVLPNGLQTVLFPRTASVAAAAASGEISATDADESVARAARHAVILTVPTAAVLVVLLVAGVPLLYGGRFQDTTTLGLLLLPGVLAIGFGKVLTAATTGRGHPKYALLTVAMVTPLTLVLYFVLVPTIGATGAAVSSTISYVITTLFSVVYLRRVTGIPLRRLAVPTRADFHDYVIAVRMLRRLPLMQRFAR